MSGGVDHNLLSRWPDSSATGAPAVPRPSVVQVTRADGGKVVPTATAKLVPIAPVRLLDTRNAIGVPTRTPLGADSTLELDLGLTTAQLSALAAVVLNDDDRPGRRPRLRHGVPGRRTRDPWCRRSTWTSGARRGPTW